MMNFILYLIVALLPFVVRRIFILTALDGPMNTWGNQLVNRLVFINVTQSSVAYSILYHLIEFLFFCDKNSEISNPDVLGIVRYIVVSSVLFLLLSLPSFIIVQLRAEEGLTKAVVSIVVLVILFNIGIYVNSNFPFVYHFSDDKKLILNTIFFLICLHDFVKTVFD
ncbi:hypothetical protein [Halobacteriovorax sp. DA5]|uniref:hypothetical protein n=1 Tax=Halobacteriovorax sp. DA5 TaxID=2067553 RepID=UPI000CD09F86|nr:hypothetical protein [Halobacteriovorax sp. DA5]POB13618.1 hypothetical protein C0Z22_10665 [Halobacteriovorax sp. DA5]